MNRLLVRTTAVAVFVLTVSLAAPAQSSFTTEGDWRSAYKQAQADQSSAKTLKWSGLGLAAGGAAIAIFGVRGTQEAVCTVNGLACTNSNAANSVIRTGGVTSYNTGVERKTRWSIVAAGAGAGGLGGFLFKNGKAKKAVADERLHQLETVGRDKGWRITFEPVFSNGAVARLSFLW